MAKTYVVWTRAKDAPAWDEEPHECATREQANQLKATAEARGMIARIAVMDDMRPDFAGAISIYSIPPSG